MRADAACQESSALESLTPDDIYCHGNRSSILSKSRTTMVFHGVDAALFVRAGAIEPNDLPSLVKRGAWTRICCERYGPWADARISARKDGKMNVHIDARFLLREGVLENLPGVARAWKNHLANLPGVVPVRFASWQAPIV